MYFSIILGLLLCLSCAESEESTGDNPEFPPLENYIKIGDSGGSEYDLTEFLNSHYIRLRLPRSNQQEVTKGALQSKAEHSQDFNVRSRHTRNIPIQVIELKGRHDLDRSCSNKRPPGKRKGLRKLLVLFLVLFKLKTFIVVSAFALLAVVGLTLTKSFAVVIHQDNYGYYPNEFKESWQAAARKSNVNSDAAQRRTRQLTRSF